jgi:hypothetical protein
VTEPKDFDPQSVVGMLIDAGEILSVPTWNEEHQEWRALIAVTPSGPMIVAALKITRLEPSP